MGRTSWLLLWVLSGIIAVGLCLVANVAMPLEEVPWVPWRELLN